MPTPRLTSNAMSDADSMELSRIWREATNWRTAQGPSYNVDAADARMIRRLPALACDFYPDIEKFGWSPELVLLLTGTRDPKSPLHAVCGSDATIVRHIYSFIASKWAKYVTLTPPASCVGKLGRLGKLSSTRGEGLHVFPRGRNRPHFGQRYFVGAQPGLVAWASCGAVVFPEPTDRNVNMMPFRFGDKESLPKGLQCYHDSCIEKCPYMQEEVGKVGYLTIHESFVHAGETQRRQGLHIESPGVFSDDPNASEFDPGKEHSWGCGVFFEPDRYHGGIYMASNVSDTSELWDALVDKNVPGIVDRHGGCEHLRRLMEGTSSTLAANELAWMTDCTPHAALPQKKAGYRQFFRVVTSHVSHWYADHSTPNPLVPLPDHVKVIHGSKFG